MSGAPEGIYEPGIVDPGFPNPTPTNPFWLSTPHPLANHQSAWPTDPMDVVIIGSGISGMSLARTMLARRPDLRITLVEARSLCSGATGRNGGHIKTMLFGMWEERKRSFGIEEAVRLSAFEYSHLEAMTAAINEGEGGSDECDLVLTEGIEAYYDHNVFDRAVAALEDMRVHAPYLADKHTVYTDKDRLQQEIKLSSRCVGAISVPAASLWPYKWVTGVLGRLIEAGKLNTQTHTTVQAIEDHAGDEFAVVRTNRGSIKARHVVHATNGWLGRLLPELRPFISPVRGNVVRHGPLARKDGQNSGNAKEPSSMGTSALGLESRYSLWLRYGSKDYDYLIQRADGDVVVGRGSTGRKATGDDSQTDVASMAHLRGFPDEVLASPVAGSAAHITHAWSGILGFTQDAVPFAGRLSLFPGRSHQWVCGGYHGTGMIKAFRVAQMVAQMIVNDEFDSNEYPKSIMVTEERIRALKESLKLGKPPAMASKL